MAATATALLLVVVLMQICGILASAARTLPGDDWLEDGIGMVMQTLGSSKSGGNGGTHCC